MCCGLPPLGGSCCGGRWGLPSSPGSIAKPAGPCPPHLSAWFWGFGFFFFFFCCVKEASRKLDPFSHRLTHTLWDKSWTPTPERGLRPAGPELQAPEENQMLPTRRELTLPARSGSPPPVVLTCHHCFLSQKRYLFLVLLFSFD